VETTSDFHEKGFNNYAIPAPSMAEMWRELPHQTTVFKESDTETCANIPTMQPAPYFMSFTANPTDALIYLRIWLERRREKV